MSQRFSQHFSSEALEAPCFGFSLKSHDEIISLAAFNDHYFNDRY
jgi:hypothetical protein